MADELIKTFDGKLTEINSIITMLNKLVTSYKDARKFEESEFKRGILNVIKLSAAITGKFENSSAVMSGEVTDAITSFLVDAVTWKVKLYPGMFAEAEAWTSTNIQASGTFTAIQSVPTVIFTTVISVGDVVEVINAEDPENNGLHTVSGVAAQELTVGAISGGADNTTDETAIIRLHRKA